MKVAQHKAVFAAVNTNIAIHINTNGEGDLVGIEDFDDAMFELFYALYEREIKRLSK